MNELHIIDETLEEIGINFTNDDQVDHTQQQQDPLAPNYQASALTHDDQGDITHYTRQSYHRHSDHCSSGGSSQSHLQAPRTDTEPGACFPAISLAPSVPGAYANRDNHQMPWETNEISPLSHDPSFPGRIVLTHDHRRLPNSGFATDYGGSHSGWERQYNGPASIFGEGLYNKTNPDVHSAWPAIPGSGQMVQGPYSDTVLPAVDNRDRLNENWNPKFLHPEYQSSATSYDRRQAFPGETVSMDSHSGSGGSTHGGSHSPRARRLPRRAPYEIESHGGMKPLRITPNPSPRAIKSDLSNRFRIMFGLSIVTRNKDTGAESVLISSDDNKQFFRGDLLNRIDRSQVNVTLDYRVRGRTYTKLTAKALPGRKGNLVGMPAEHAGEFEWVSGVDQSASMLEMFAGVKACEKPTISESEGVESSIPSGPTTQPAHITAGSIQNNHLLDRSGETCNKEDEITCNGLAMSQRVDHHKLQNCCMVHLARERKIKRKSSDNKKKARKMIQPLLSGKIMIDRHQFDG